MFFSCSRGERAPPSGSTECVIIYSFRQVMVTNVTSLLKTVKAVEDEATRGTRALEATIEYVKQELTVRAPSGPPASSSRPSGSQPTRRSLPRRADSGRVRDICVCYSHENKGAPPPHPLYYLSGSFPPCFPVSPCRVLAALIRVWGEDAGRARKARGPLQLAFCNLMLILRQPVKEGGFTRGRSQRHISAVYTCLI